MLEFLSHQIAAAKSSPMGTRRQFASTVAFSLAAMAFLWWFTTPTEKAAFARGELLADPTMILVPLVAAALFGLCCGIIEASREERRAVWVELSRSIFGVYVQTLISKASSLATLFSNLLKPWSILFVGAVPELSRAPRRTESAATLPRMVSLCWPNGVSPLVLYEHVS